MAIKDLDQWIAELRAHRDTLHAELQRVDAALALLQQPRAPLPEPAAAPGRTPPPSSRSSVPALDLIAQLFRDNPDTEYDAVQVYEWLQAQGVRQEAQDPVNSVRGALSRLKRRGVIIDVRRGIFKLRQDEEATGEPNFDTPPDGDDQQPSQDDPWSTPTRDIPAKSTPVNRGGFNDEPPF